MGRAEDIFDRLVAEGEAVIDEFIETRQSEELFLEFKRSADNGSGTKLHPTDRQNLADAISGFGNSEGGVLVWGIECRDTATDKRPLVDVQKFVSWLQHAISGCTVPPHASVRHHAIVSAGSGSGGFVVTLIPKSNHVPHQVTGRNQYYIRAGSSFVPTPHAVLAGMFGRRPQPNIICQYTIPPATIVPPSDGPNPKVKIQLTIWLHNTGLGIARDLFLNLRIWKAGSKTTTITFHPSDGTVWSGRLEMGKFYGLISQPHVRVPPEGTLSATTFDMILVPPFSDEIRIEGNFGCAGMPPVPLKFGTTVLQLVEDYNLLLAWKNLGTLTDKLSYRFVARVFGIEDEAPGQEGGVK
jgi:hypothetical protein